MTRLLLNTRLLIILHYSENSKDTNNVLALNFQTLATQSSPFLALALKLLLRQQADLIEKTDFYFSLSLFPTGLPCQIIPEHTQE